MRTAYSGQHTTHLITTDKKSIIRHTDFQYKYMHIILGTQSLRMGHRGNRMIPLPLLPFILLMLYIFNIRSIVFFFFYWHGIYWITTILWCVLFMQKATLINIWFAYSFALFVYLKKQIFQNPSKWKYIFDEFAFYHSQTHWHQLHNSLNCIQAAKTAAQRKINQKRGYGQFLNWF